MSLNEDEKLGGLAFEQCKTMDFAFFINSNALPEVKFTGSNFTWWNGRIERDYIFKRHDRIIVNHYFMDLFPSSEVQHFIRQGSDHVPLH